MATVVPAPARAHEGLDLQLQAIARAIAQQPDDPGLHLERLQLLRRAGRLQAAQQALQAARSRAIDDPRLTLEEALLAAAQHRDAEALAAFEVADRLGLATAESEEARGDALLRTGRPAQAIRHLELSARLGPTPDRFLRLGRLLRSRGRLRAARQALARGLETLGPSEVLTRTLVTLLLDMGEHASALQRIDAEIRLRPAGARWHRLRAQALAALGRPQQARAARARALALAEHAALVRPSAAHALELARNRRASGDAHGAVEALRDVLARDPQNRKAQRLGRRWGVLP